MLSGAGRDVRSVRACACFVGVRQVEKDRLFRPSWGTRVPIKEAGRGRGERERHPEWHQRRLTVTKTVPKPPTENQQKTKNGNVKKNRRKLRLRRENINKHMGNVKSQSEFFRRVWKSKRAPKAVQRGLRGGFWMLLGSILEWSARQKQPEGRAQERRGNSPHLERFFCCWLQASYMPPGSGTLAKF